MHFLAESSDWVMVNNSCELMLWAMNSVLCSKRGSNSFCLGVGRSHRRLYTEEVTSELGLSKMLTFLVFSGIDKLFMRLEHNLPKASNNETF